MTTIYPGVLSDLRSRLSHTYSTTFEFMYTFQLPVSTIYEFILGA